MDEALKKEKNQDIIDLGELSQKKVRKVWDMNNHKYDDMAPQNLEDYNVKEVQAENEKIEGLLSSSNVSDVMTNEDRAHLQNMQGRNSSFLLVNQQKFLGDSDLMGDVKKAVIRLEKSLGNKVYDVLNQGAVKDNFEDAIAACEKYLSKKHPWFPTGRKRKKMVMEQLARLQKEYESFKNGMRSNYEDVAVGERKDLGSMHDVIEMGMVYDKERTDFSKEYGNHFSAMTKHIDKVMTNIPESKKLKKGEALNEGDMKEVTSVLRGKDTYDTFKIGRVRESENDDFTGNDGALLSYSKKGFYNGEYTNKIDEFYKSIRENDASDSISYDTDVVLRKFLAEYQKDWQAIDAMEFTCKEVLEKGSDPKVEDKLRYYLRSVKLMKKHVEMMERVITKVVEGKKLTAEEEQQVPSNLVKEYKDLQSEKRW